jgi:hypothetical protein
MRARGMPQHFQVSNAINVVDKDGLSIVAPLDQVMRIAGNEQSGCARHGAKRHSFRK